MCMMKSIYIRICYEALCNLIADNLHRARLRRRLFVGWARFDVCLSSVGIRLQAIYCSYLQLSGRVSLIDQMQVSQGNRAVFV